MGRELDWSADDDAITPAKSDHGYVSDAAGTDCEIVDEFLKGYTGTRELTPDFEWQDVLFKRTSEDDLTKLRDELGNAALERLRGLDASKLRAAGSDVSASANLHRGLRKDLGEQR